MSARKPNDEYARRYFARHPLILIQRVWAWWRWQRRPPWRLRWSQLLIIDPSPLTPRQLEALQRKLDEPSGASSRGRASVRSS